LTETTGRARHIALVLHDFSGGGSERIAIRLATRWAASGRRVTLVAGTEAGVARGLADRLAVVAFDAALTRSIPDRLRFGRAAAGMIAALAPDVVVSPGNWHVPTFSAARIAGLRLPIVAKISNPVRFIERGPPFQRVQNAAFARATAHYAALVAMSPALAVEAEAVLRRPVATIAEPNLPDDWVGAGWHLDLLGDGRERAALVARAAALGVSERVTFHGHVADTALYLRAATAFLCSSRYEGYPAVLIEALAAGTPVVTTPCSPAVPEIMSDASFGAVAPPDPAALAAAVRAVTGRVPDPALVAARLDQHRIGASATAWLALLDRVAG